MAKGKSAQGTERSGRLKLPEVLADLVADGIVGQADADEILETTAPREKSDMHPLRIIAGYKLTSPAPPHETVTLDQLSEWLAGRVGLEFRRIDPLKIDLTSVSDVVSYAYAARYKILPVEVKPSSVVIATSEPYMTDWTVELARIINKEIVLAIANPEDIERYRLEFYNVSRSVKGAVAMSQDSSLLKLQNLEQLVELGRTGKLDANDQHVVSIVNWIFQYAFDQRASDIHMEPRREAGNIRFRIDGVMHRVYQLPPSVMAAALSRIKILGRLDVAEKRRPQDGRMKTKTPGGREVEMRLSTMPTAFGEKLVIRIFDPDILVTNFKTLGFCRRESEVWADMISRPNGIILVTGPTGSGKTTTLYSTLKVLARPEVNVCSVEDPIEMVEPTFNQMQVHHAIGLDFAAGIRTLLRQDPDIIMVGEIRDLETARMAVQASLTGHLVLSTLHTNDSVSAITRALHIGVPYYLIRATLLGVMAQRLVRTLCPECKEKTAVNDEMWDHLSRPWRLKKPQYVYEPVGCLECRNTGYKGRVGLFEMLPLTQPLQSMITEQFDEPAFRKAAYREGMRPLRISGLQKIFSGATTFDEVVAVAGTGEHEE